MASQNSKPTREMFSRVVGCRTSIWIVGTSRYHQVPERCCLYSLLEMRSGDDIVAAEVKDRKFREEASSRAMPAAIVERIERTNATDVYDKDDVYARGEFPLSGGDPARRGARIPKPRLEPKPRPDGARNTSNFLLRFSTAGKRRIYYGQFHGISLDRPGPSEKTSGPPELIIRRVHTRRESCICHWHGRGCGRVRRGGIGSLFRCSDQR